MSASRDTSQDDLIEIDLDANDNEPELSPAGNDAGAGSQRDDRLEAEQRDDDDFETSVDTSSMSDEQKREERRKFRAEKRKREREYVSVLENELAKQREQLALLQQQVTQQTTSTVEQRYRDALEHVRRAERAMQDAVERGDGAQHVEAMRYRDEALTKARELGGHIQRMRNGGQVQQPMQPDPELLKRAQSWASKHSWYNPSGTDVDSQVVQAVDNEVAREGFDPRTTDYWEELTERLRDKLPHRFKVAERKAPAVSGRSEPTTPNGKRTVRISPEMKAALQEAGIWDDPKRRNKALADHFRILNER